MSTVECQKQLFKKIHAFREKKKLTNPIENQEVKGN